MFTFIPRINSDEILSLIKALGGQTECKHVQDLVRACELNNGSLGRKIQFHILQLAKIEILLSKIVQNENLYNFNTLLIIKIPILNKPIMPKLQF